MSGRWYLVNGVWQDGAGRAVECAPLQDFVYLGGRPGIPMAVAQEAHKEYEARHGRIQTLARLNERGGFGAAELAILLYDRCKRLEQSRLLAGAKP